MISFGLALITGISALFGLAATGTGFVIMTQLTVASTLLAKARKAEEENNETFTLWQLNGRDGFLMDSELTIKTMLEKTHSDKAAQLFVSKLWDLGDDMEAMKKRREFVRAFRVNYNASQRAA